MLFFGGAYGMKALFKHKPEPGAELREAPEPGKPKAGEALVKVKATSICGTDKHIYEWDAWAQSRIKTPMIFGHEFAGEVVEIGEGVSEVAPGDFVSGETHIYCGKCFLCRTGNMHICENVKLRGVDVTGCFAEYLLAPANTLWKNDKGIKLEAASAQEPLGNAVHTVFEGNHVKGQKVTIFCAGPIGMAATSVCKAEGAEQVIVVDGNEYRLSLAKKMGATATINRKRENVVRRIMGLTGGKGADVFLEMSGGEDAYVQGFATLRPGGRASLLGIPKGKITLDITNAIVFKQARVFGINGRRIWGTWEKSSELLKSGKVNLETIITHKFKLEEFEKAFELMKSGNCGKVVMYP